MGAFDRVDRALDRMERFDDWVRDQFPASWVKTVPAPPRRTDDERRSDLLFVAGLVARMVVPALVLTGWLVLRGTWWSAILAAVVTFVVASVVAVIVREIRRRD